MTTFADISDLVVPFDTLSFGGQTFQLWGLTAPQIIWIVRQHGSDLAPLYLDAVEGKLPADVAAVQESLGDSFGPLLVATIACGMGKQGDGKAATNIAKLPLSVQLEAVDKILKLTFAAEGGLGNVVEIVTRALAGLKPLLPRKT